VIPEEPARRCEGGSDAARKVPEMVYVFGGTLKDGVHCSANGGTDEIWGNNFGEQSNESNLSNLGQDLGSLITLTAIV
jgi:hypothetical protein